MNFMAPRQPGGGGGGYYEDDPSREARPFPQLSSATCSTSPPSHHHHQYQQQRDRLVPPSYSHHQPRGPWDGRSLSFRGYSCGGASQLDLMVMDSSSSPTANGSSCSNSNNNNVEDAEESRLGGGNPTTSSSLIIEREHMFDKVVTPSDVGKLNRLVIPKQHAEKYFPLDSSTNEKGLLLNFEDRNGKPWRFRYSYWNSSQSYVMTKGWSRFVKEKKLDAGDIVSFQRGVGELGKDRLFIDWRRRPDAPDRPHLPPSMSTTSFSQLLPHHQYSFRHPWNHPFYLQHHQQQQTPRDHSQLLQLNNAATGVGLSNNPHPSHPHHLSNNYAYGNVMTGNPCSGPIIYLRSAAAARPHPVGLGIGTVQLLQKGGGGGSVGLNSEELMVEGEGEEEEPMVFESVPLVQGKAAAKRLRLFGVNMDCPISESSSEDQEDDNCDILVLPSTAVPHPIVPSQFPHLCSFPSQPPPSSSSSSSSSSTCPLQLRPYNYASRPPLHTMPSNNSSSSDSKGKASMSLDLDIHIDGVAPGTRE